MLTTTPKTIKKSDEEARRNGRMEGRQDRSETNGGRRQSSRGGKVGKRSQGTGEGEVKVEN